MEGDLKYGAGNWQKGNKEFFVDCLGHAIEHLMLFAWDDHESLETHLGHAATNIALCSMGTEEKQVYPGGPAECCDDREPNAFDRVFEEALTDHDRMLLWLFHICVEPWLDIEWADRDKWLSSKLPPRASKETLSRPTPTPLTPPRGICPEFHKQ